MSFGRLHRPHSPGGCSNLFFCLRASMTQNRGTVTQIITNHADYESEFETRHGTPRSSLHKLQNSYCVRNHIRRPHPWGGRRRTICFFTSHHLNSGASSLYSVGASNKFLTIAIEFQKCSIKLGRSNLGLSYLTSSGFEFTMTLRS